MKNNNRFILGGLATAALTGCGGQPEPPRRPMNILYIMTDDHTSQMMSCYDGRYASTPNLDRIAEEGVRFTNSFVANSLSGPSRACMLTGKHSHKNGFYDNTTCVFDGSQQTFPKLLRKAGYETAIVGKWHLESLPTGFDHWEILPGQGDYYNPDFIRQTGDTVRCEGYITNIITDKSIEWLEHGRDPEKPFCLVVHHKAQHRNWMADTCDLALFEDRTFPVPETFYDDYEGRPAAAAQEMSIASNHDMDPIYDLKMRQPGRKSRLSDAYEAMIGRMNPEQRAAWDRFYEPIAADFYARNPQGRELAEWKFTRYMRDYLKTLKSLDDNVGRLLDYLEESGLAGNTLVVYTSDQGFYMGEHGWFDKRFMYEESLRTPLVMRMPGGAKGQIAEMVQNIDYAPHVPRAGRSARTRGHSGPVAAAPAAGRASGRLERVDLLPFLRIPGRAHGETPLRSARRTMEADTLLRRHRRVGTLRPRSRSPRAAQSLRKSGLRRRAGADDEGAGKTPDAVRRHGGDGKERILRP